MNGFKFTKYVPPLLKDAQFDELLNIFLQLLTISSGDVAQALEWLNQIDRNYNLTSPEYGVGDFIDDLKKLGYINEDRATGALHPTAKSEKTIRKQALEEIFGKLKRGNLGNHRTPFTGFGDELTAERREFQFGDTLDKIDLTESLKNAQINHGLDDFRLTEGDLEIQEKDFKAATSTVLMIDISHSMILYGEDRITPAKKVAMALAELITRKYPKDTLDIIVFGDDAHPVQIR
ncbi:MAG: hypothetical protein B6D45_06320, partial [Ignavibacteriales bacterium UTCHB3]